MESVPGERFKARAVAAAAFAIACALVWSATRPTPSWPVADQDSRAEPHDLDVDGRSSFVGELAASAGAEARAAQASVMSPDTKGGTPGRGLDPIDIIVRTTDGRGLLDPRSRMLEPVVLRRLGVVISFGTKPTHRITSRSRVVRPGGRRVRSADGWYASIARSWAPAWGSLVYDGYVVASVPVDASSSAVEIVADVADVDGALCTVCGMVVGGDAEIVVTATPVLGEGQYGVPVHGRVSKSGRGPSSFELARVPPGPILLEITPRTRGEGWRFAEPLTPKPFGGSSKAGPLEWWKKESAAIVAGPAPLRTMELELSRGETRELGVVATDVACAAHLELIDESGAPIAASDVRTRRIRNGDRGSTAISQFPYGNQTVVYPLPPGTAELVLSAGQRTAVVTVPTQEYGSGSPMVPIQVVLTAR